jgi:hypothetical protein
MFVLFLWFLLLWNVVVIAYGTLLDCWSRRCSLTLKVETVFWCRSLSGGCGLRSRLLVCRSWLWGIRETRVGFSLPTRVWIKFSPPSLLPGQLYSRRWCPGAKGASCGTLSAHEVHSNPSAWTPRPSFLWNPSPCPHPVRPKRLCHGVTQSRLRSQESMKSRLSSVGRNAKDRRWCVDLRGKVTVAL